MRKPKDWGQPCPNSDCTHQRLMNRGNISAISTYLTQSGKRRIFLCNWLRVVFEKMDIQSAHESTPSGWHVFETNTNRFALSPQVHGTKPVDNFLQHIKGRPMTGRFDGHANCFIESGNGKGLLIDFNYDVEPLPGKYPLPGIGPFSLLKETEANHWGKLMFKWTYWNVLLPGRDLPIAAQMSMAGKKPMAALTADGEYPVDLVRHRADSDEPGGPDRPGPARSIP